MKAVKWLDRHLEEILLVALLFIMMIIMGIQIVARYALGNSLSWSEEITRFCFIWTGFLSISYCVKNSKSIKIEQFVEWFKDDFNGMGVHAFRLVSYLVELILFAYLLPFAYHFVRASYLGKAASPAVGIPMWIVQSITVISFGLCEIRLLQKFVSRIGMIRRGEKEKDTPVDGTAHADPYCGRSCCNWVSCSRPDDVLCVTDFAGIFAGAWMTWTN